MPEVDVCWKVQFADHDVSARFVLEAARQRGESRADVRDTCDLFETCLDHLRKEPTRVDDHGQPFLPVLTIVAPVRQVLVDAVQNIDRWRTSSCIIEGGSSRRYWNFLSEMVNIKGGGPF